MKVIFYNIKGIGHLNPTIPFVKSLAQKGVEIIYYTYPERKKLVEAAGARFCNYGDDNFKTEQYNPGKNFVQQLIPATVGILPFLAKKLQIECPDLLIYDSMAPWGYCLSKMFSIPAICMVSTFALNAKIRQDMYDFYSVAVDDKNRKAIVILKEKYNITRCLLDALGSYNDCNLVFTSKNFNPPLANMPSQNFHFVGPMITGRDEKIDFPLHKIMNTSRKIIYMSLGTILGEDDPSLIELFKMFISAFAEDKRFLLVLSIGKHFLVKDFDKIADNCLIYNYVPQLEILKKATIFINHAGMNSVNEGLFFATPLLTIPISGDQFANADRVATLKVGIKLMRNNTSSKEIKKLVCTLLDEPIYQKNCSAISKNFNNSLGYNGAMELIMQKLQNK